MNDRDHTTPTLVERAAAILRDEIAGGALGNVRAARAGWSTQRRDLVSAGLNRRLRADLADLLEPILDLLAPHAPEPTEATEAIPVIRARRYVAPGEVAQIHTRLRNDGPHALEISFLCSDLVAEPGDRIRSGCIRLMPGRIRVSPGDVADLEIDLDVPADTRPGLYHALLQASELAGLRALLTFPVGQGESIDRHS